MPIYGAIVVIFDDRAYNPGGIAMMVCNSGYRSLSSHNGDFR